MRIYFDVCALGRLTDDQRQQRVRDESHAVLQCLASVLHGSDQWIASVALQEEVARNTDTERRLVTQSLLATAQTTEPYTPVVKARAADLQQRGFGYYDAHHVAFAESVQADVLLTTDDRLIRLAQRLRSAAGDTEIRVEVANPVDWLARRPR